MKRCFKCEKEKPLAEFYKHKQMADGHLNKCKDCTKSDMRLHRIVSETPRGYDRLRAKTPERKAHAREVQKHWRKQNPLKYKAHNAANNAMRDGKIAPKDKCEICGSDNHIHKHHDDYSKPLDVMWLCPKCHHGRHANK